MQILDLETPGDITFGPDSKSLGSALPPIGSIIALNPDVTEAKAIDLNYYAKCDNAGGNVTLRYHDGTTEDITRPDLSDSRFLMGGTASGSGGSNNLIDHIHTSNLTAAGQSLDVANVSLSSGSAEGQDGGSHYHSLSAYFKLDGTSPEINIDSANVNFSYNNTKDTDSKSHTHNASAVSGTTNIDHTHGSSSVTGTIGSGSVPTSTSNLPQYFNVKYFMRIK